MYKKFLIIGISILMLFSFNVTIDNSASANPISFTFNFKNGWNLITLPVENNYNAKTLSALINGCTMISRYDSTNQTYVSYIVAVPDAFNFEIEDGVGYNILIETNSSTLTISGNQITDKIVDLKQNLNLLGWYKSQSTTASAIYNSIVGCTQVFKFDATTQSYIYYNSSQSNDFPITQGMGYFVKINGGYNLNLMNGWNCFSLPIKIADNHAEAVFQGINCYPILYWYEAGAAQYDWWGSGDGHNPIIKPGVGYSIRSYENVTKTIPGYKITNDLSINIQPSFASISWVRDSSTAAETLGQSIPGCTIIAKNEGFSGDTPIWSEHTVGTSQNNFQITKGMYILVYTSLSSIWDGNANYVPEEPPLSISCPTSVTEQEDFQITVKAEGVSIQNAIVTFNGNSYYTNSNGIITLTAPSVTYDKTYSISVSKTGYQSAQKSIIVKNVVVASSIQIMSPNGGETWTNIHTIVWSITNIPVHPYSVTIQYKYQDNSWINIVEDIVDNENIYSWDTTSVTDGYPYQIKVILKEDSNSDGTFETTLSSDVSDGYFAIDNAVTSKGQIYGIVEEEVDNSSVSIQHARVYVKVSDVNGVITSKCTFTDDEGEYSVPIPKGVYTMEVSKSGYNTSKLEEIVVWTNEATEVNFILQKGTGQGSIPIFESENRDLIDDSIRNQTVGGEMTIQLEDQEEYENFVLIYTNITITPTNIKQENISLLIDGTENIGGKTIILNIAEGIFNYDDKLALEYDGEIINMADNITDVLNPDDDGSHPEYLITIGANGIQILVSIPHFSEHKISVYPLSFEKIVEEIMHYKEIAIICAIGLIAIAALAMFRKEKEY